MIYFHNLLLQVQQRSQIVDNYISNSYSLTKNKANDYSQEDLITCMMYIQIEGRSDETVEV